MKASIDQLVDKLERQVKRYREKRRRCRAARLRSEPRDAGPSRSTRRGRDRQDEAVPGQADDPRGGGAPARARRPRLLRLPERRDEESQRRLPAPRRLLRADRAPVRCGFFGGARSRSTRSSPARPASTSARGVGEPRRRRPSTPASALAVLAGGIHGDRVREWDAVATSVRTRAARRRARVRRAPRRDALVTSTTSSRRRAVAARRRARRALARRAVPRRRAGARGGRLGRRRQSGSTWSRCRRTTGDTVDLVVHDGERTCSSTSRRRPSLELGRAIPRLRLRGAARSTPALGGGSFALRRVPTRVDDAALWEVRAPRSEPIP